MPNLTEIKSRIESVKSTKKITRAMYLISVSKSKKAKVQLNAMLPYFNQVNQTLADILHVSGRIESPFLQKRNDPAGKTLYIVLAGDKGMAGGYSHNIYDLLDKNVDKSKSDLLVAGIMGKNQIKRLGYKVADDFVYPVMNPTVYRAREVAEICINKFLTGKYNTVNLIYTTMITPIKQEPVMTQILPLSSDKLLLGHGERKNSQRFKYEPDPVTVFDHIAPHYLKGEIYGAFVEAYTSEQHARTYAMDNATKSAEEMIERLSLVHNRARQAKITQEITEIVSGIPTE
ncbi:ATP synthase gamma chain [Clostridia bacterium]|nr:ATP synthase gamma chain [Clostridia bacterium]